MRAVAKAGIVASLQADATINAVKESTVTLNKPRRSP